MQHLLNNINAIHEFSPYQLAWKLSQPILYIYMPLGIAFGILFTNLGFPWYYASAMSALVYAGSVQFVALGVLAVGGGILELWLATIFIASRNAFYGLSLLHRCPKSYFKKHYFIFGLVDATYAVLTTVPKLEDSQDSTFSTYFNLLTHSYWIIGTTAGAYYCHLLPQIKGLEFILTCFFMVMVVEHVLTYKKLHVVVLAIIAALVSNILTPTTWLLTATLICVITIIFWQLRSENDSIR